MIIAPSTALQLEHQKNQRQMIANFMRNLAGVDPSDSTIYLGWFVESKTEKGSSDLAVAVALNGFMGNVCQIHVAMAPNYNYSPKEMLQAAFRYAFETLGRERLIGIVNSNNEKAMVYDKHLGFEELTRIEGAHDEGGDIVIFSMTKEQCKYLKEKTDDDKKARGEKVTH